MSGTETATMAAAAAPARARIPVVTIPRARINLLHIRATDRRSCTYPAGPYDNRPGTNLLRLRSHRRIGRLHPETEALQIVNMEHPADRACHLFVIRSPWTILECERPPAGPSEGSLKPESTHWDREQLARWAWDTIMAPPE
jgi:hypothetical protein